MKMVISASSVRLLKRNRATSVPLALPDILHRRLFPKKVPLPPSTVRNVQLMLKFLVTVTRAYRVCKQMTAANARFDSFLTDCNSKSNW